MKRIRMHKQGKAKVCLRKRYGLNGRTYINMESISVKSERDGVISVSANLVGRPTKTYYHKGKLIENKVVEAVQKLALKKVIASECLVDFQLKGYRGGFGTYGVWPPYRIIVKNGNVINVEIIKK